MPNRPIRTNTINGLLYGHNIEQDFDVLNVADFGALGDNSTDDTIAIQDAINEAQRRGGGTVSLQSGKIYKISDELRINKNYVNFDGNYSRITTTVDKSIFFLPERNFCNIANLRLYCPVTNTKPMILHTHYNTSVARCSFRNIYFAPTTSPKSTGSTCGIQIDGSNWQGYVYNRWDNLEFYHLDTAIKFSSLGNAWANSNTFTHICIEDYITGLDVYPENAGDFQCNMIDPIHASDQRQNGDSSYPTTTLIKLRSQATQNRISFFGWKDRPGGTSRAYDMSKTTSVNTLMGSTQLTDNINSGNGNIVTDIKAM